MNQNDIEHLAQGFPPSHIGKDHEEVVTELAKHALELQQKLDAVLAKGMELAQEAAHVYSGYNKEMAPDVACDGQTIQEFHDLADGFSSVDAYLNAVRAEAIEQAAEKAPWLYGDQMGRSVEAIPKEQLIKWAAQLRAETDTTPSQYESLAGGE